LQAFDSKIRMAVAGEARYPVVMNDSNHGSAAFCLRQA
jgi:hypothetical protein